MSLQVTCPNPACVTVGVVEESMVGGTARCPSCGTTFYIDAPQPHDPHAAVTIATDLLTNQTAPLPVEKPPSTATGRPKRIGRFEVRARLGAGAFGVVYRAFDPNLQREVALKVLHPEALSNPERVERFQREAREAARLRHPNIVAVFETGRDGSQHFIASAYIKGQTLRTALGDKPMKPGRAARIVCDLSEAVAYAHRQGVVHRDLKPANVLLDENDEPHLVDFGLVVRPESAGELTKWGTVLGTPAYLAPEQARGQTGKVQPATDQYSLGVILYELLTGRTPFQGTTSEIVFHAVNSMPPQPRTLNAEVPPELERICLKAMARQPKDRYDDCQQFADALRNWLDGKPEESAPAVKAGPEQARGTRSRWRIISRMFLWFFDQD